MSIDDVPAGRAATARPRDRALYLAALAVGLCEAHVADEHALATLRTAVRGRPGDLRAAWRRLYASKLGSCTTRRAAARLLQLAAREEPGSGPRRVGTPRT